MLLISSHLSRYAARVIIVLVRKVFGAAGIDQYVCPRALLCVVRGKLYQYVFVGTC